MSSDQPSKLYLARRDLLRLSGFTGLNFLLGGCSLGLFDDAVYRATEPLNRTVEELIFNPEKLIPEFPISAIEPDKLIVNSFNTFIPTPQIDPKIFRLQINGEVARPLSLSMADINRMPLTTMTIRHVCVEGWAAIVQWGGVKLRELAALARPQDSVRYVFFKSFDGYYESWDIASALHPQTLMAYQMNGQPLPADNGAPLRLASPIKLGYKLSKWVTEITFLRQKPEKLGYWEDQGYEWFAGL